MAQSYDVIIVGGGPAGSTAASFLAQQGIKTIVVDKSHFPREKACGGGIPMKVLRRFSYIKEFDVIDSYSYGGKLSSPSYLHTASVLKKQPVIAMVQRNRFDNALLQYAQQSGAKSITGKKAVQISVHKKNVKILLDDGTVLYSDIVIGADGFTSSVAQQTGLYTHHQTSAICVYNEYTLSEQKIQQWFTDNREIHIVLNPDTIFGYGWVFPKKKSVNIGIGELWKVGQKKRVRNLKQAYQKFLVTLKQQKLIPPELNPTIVHGGGLPLHACDQTVDDRVIVCGDAAGFVNPSSGEGIYYAIVSGEHAANVIANALSQGDPSKKGLSEYEHRWMHDFGRDLRLMERVTQKWFSHGETFVRRISSDPVLSELCFDVMTGDQPLQTCKWQLLHRFFGATLRDIFS